MRLGLSSFVYRYATSSDTRNTQPMDALTLLRRAYAYGLDAVQYSDNMPLHLLTQEELTALRDLGSELGLDVEVGAKGMDRGYLHDYVSLALFFGSRALRLVLDEPDPERAEAGLRWLAPRLEQANLPLAIENHGEMPARELAALVERIGHPLLRYCVDTANNLILLERPLDTMAPLAPRALQLHLKDYVVERAPVGYRMTGRVLGEGSLDMDATLNLIRPVERDLDVYLEAWMDPAPTWAETLLQEEQWIAGSIDCARQALGNSGGAQ
ncbi:MAG: TIM barrel protein [Anaerolineae bacterium]